MEEAAEAVVAGLRCSDPGVPARLAALPAVQEGQVAHLSVELRISDTAAVWSPNLLHHPALSFDLRASVGALAEQAAASGCPVLAPAGQR